MPTILTHESREDPALIERVAIALYTGIGWGGDRANWNHVLSDKQRNYFRCLAQDAIEGMVGGDR
jgi:hypothetical protein